ncbi:hypothetical protein [Tabrizicola sp.]|uniref:hypothetical protein n=1 Tax=Tabrizicola sp. TaxID=2005166 RepID=UPI003D2A5C81
MHSLSPADELGEIRAEIARLKAREAALRAQFLRAPQDKTLGRWTKVEVVETRQTRFNPALLPDEIRRDPRYCEDRLVQSVRCLPAPLVVSVRPGWPLRREGAQMH